MKYLVINWLGALLIAGMVILFSFVWIRVPYGMSDGHKAADARYRLCLQTMVEVNTGKDYATIDPSKCDGALGEYQKPPQ